MKPSVPQHEERIRKTERDEFRSLLGPEAEERRAAEIAALPVVEWKGKQLRTLTCQAVFGRGPHRVNVPESVLWCLLDLRTYRCPWHR